MVSRKISIPLIIIVAAVVVLLVSINQPFQRAEAIERQEITATETSVQELQPSDQEEWNVSQNIHILPMGSIKNPL